MPSLIAGMGYSNIEAQLLTVPPYILASIWSILLAWLSQRSSKRGPWILLSAPICVVGSGMLLGSSSRAVQYTGIFLVEIGGTRHILLESCGVLTLCSVPFRSVVFDLGE